MRHLVAATVAAAALGACNLTDTHSRQQQLGLLRLSPEDSINWTVPDTVALNTDFEISVTTHGGSCDRKGPTDVVPLANGTIDFKPFDITEVTSDDTCPLQAQTFTHTGSLKIGETGPKTITLWGRDWNLGLTSRVKSVVVK